MDELEDGAMAAIQRYRDLVLAYEQLDEQIDQFLMASGGTTERMSTDVVARYREMARQRDELLNEMRALENELQIDDDRSNETDPEI
ncbi:MAG: hypothetical protein SNJ59_05970 [Aggregatilineales bacterium]